MELRPASKRRYRLVFVALEHPWPVEARLKGILKIALRRFGFRCVEARPEPETQTQSQSK
jgi:hypothetical protein